MTFQLLSKIMKENNIPEDVELFGDSGWECDETAMDGIYYNRKENKMIFTQDGTCYDHWFDEEGWELLYGHNKTCQTCSNLIDHECHHMSYMFINDSNECNKYQKK